MDQASEHNRCVFRIQRQSLLMELAFHIRDYWQIQKGIVYDSSTPNIIASLSKPLGCMGTPPLPKQKLMTHLKLKPEGRSWEAV